MSLHQKHILLLNDSTTSQKGEPLDSNRGIYQGKFDKTRTGQGKLISDGRVYEGKFINGLITGDGKLTCTSYVYEGNFLHGKASGNGKCKTSEGCLYEGEFLDGKYSGHGKLILKEGVYEGEFLDGKRTGKGVFTTPDGESKPVFFLEDNVELQYCLRFYFKRLAILVRNHFPEEIVLLFASFFHEVTKKVELVHLLTAEKNVLLEDTISLLKEAFDSMKIALNICTTFLMSCPEYHDAWILLVTLLCKANDKLLEVDEDKEIFLGGLYYIAKGKCIEKRSVELFSYILETFNTSCEMNERRKEEFSIFLLLFLKNPLVEGVSWKWKIVKFLSSRTFDPIPVDTLFSYLTAVYKEFLNQTKVESGMQYLLICFSKCFASKRLKIQYQEIYRNFVLKKMFALFKQKEKNYFKDSFTSLHFFEIFMEMVEASVYFKVSEDEMIMCLQLGKNMTYMDDRIVFLVRSFEFAFPSSHDLISEMINILDLEENKIDDSEFYFLHLKNYFVKINVYFIVFNKSHVQFIGNGIGEIEMFWDGEFSFILKSLRKISVFEEHDFQIYLDCRKDIIANLLEILDNTNFGSHDKLCRILESVCRYLVFFSSGVEKYCRHEAVMNESEFHESLYNEMQLYCMNTLTHIHRLCHQNISTLDTNVDELSLNRTWRFLRALRKGLHCASCMKVAFLRCSCGSDTRYCSSECQKVDWRFHKESCSRRSHGSTVYDVEDES
jgi:hypothetical protein